MCPPRTGTKRELLDFLYDHVMPHDFRFGFGLHAADSQSAVQDAAARAEDFGYDVLHVPDHLGAPAPFPTLTAAAMATRTLRLGTFVLNAGFYLSLIHI